MKDITGNQVTTQGNISHLDATTCGIDENGLGHILNVLSNVYSNKNLAVIREYSANARDSHVEAGQTRPIEVTLPTLLQPTFLVQDYGIGLSKDGILKTFGVYGTSTKRESNELIGALGIGSKAAFTLGQQFIVTGVKAGLKTVVLFALNDQNLPTMTVMADEVSTNEPNGVLISLAVEDVYTFSEEAHKFFSLWDQGTVLVDGEEPTPIWDGANKINDRTFIADGDSDVFVVMGSIKYRVEPALLRTVRNTFDSGSAYAVADSLTSWYVEHSLLIKVDIGDVDIAPSREALRDTPRTVAALQSYVQEIANTLTTSVQEKVNAEPNALDAILTFTALRESLKPLTVSRKDITYHGLAMTESVKVFLPTVHLRNKTHRGEAKVVNVAYDYVNLSVAQAKKTLVIRLGKDETLAQVQRLAKRFLEESEYDFIVVTDADALSFDWFTFGSDAGGAPVWTLAEYRAECKELRANDIAAYPRNAPAYRTGWGSARKYDNLTPLTEIIDLGKDIIIYGKNAWADSLTQAALADYTIVRLFGAQTSKMITTTAEKAGLTVYSSHNVEGLVAEYAKSKVAAVSDAKRTAMGAYSWLSEQGLSLESDWERIVAKLGGTDDIHSETFLAVYSTITLARVLSKTLTDLQRAELIAAGVEEIPFEFDGEILDLDETFPLLDSYSVKHSSKFKDTLRQHVVDYLTIN